MVSMKSSQVSLFHLAFPVNDLNAARTFYVETLGCGIGRQSDRWVDLDFYGHQIVAHLVDKTVHENSTSEPSDSDSLAANSNPVDGHDVPVPHFGLILDWDRWHDLADRLKQSNIDFVIEPYIRFEGQPGEQATMFFNDPSGNALEFKAFKDPAAVFAT